MILRRSATNVIRRLGASSHRRHNVAPALYCYCSVASPRGWTKRQQQPPPPTTKSAVIDFYSPPPCTPPSSFVGPPLLNTTRSNSTMPLQHGHHARRGRQPPPAEVDERRHDVPSSSHRRNKDFTASTIPDFDDPASAHANKTLTELLRAVLVYQLCRVQPLVDNAEILSKLSRKVFGDAFTDYAMKRTFFGHFCGGEDEVSVGTAIEGLRGHGIGGILDYAAENDVDDDDGGSSSRPSPSSDDGGIVSAPPYNQPARVYDYTSERQCDLHVETFLRCIDAVRDVSPDGFAAVKVTALGNPLLLERMSNAINEARNLFGKFDADGDGIVTRDEFANGYRLFFNDAEEKLDGLLAALDPLGSNAVDYIEWSKLLTPSSLPKVTASCREVGPLALASPSEEEMKLMEATRRRLHVLAERASDSGVRLLIDAEHRKFQPAIDNLILDVQQKYNATDRTDEPVIFGTYQCYLKDALERLRTDVERSRRNSFHFAAKLVRGAYMTYERERADEMGYTDPIHDAIEDTHSCYDEALDYLLRYRVDNDDVNLEVMCATHNRDSIERAIKLMNDLGIDASDGTVHFAQLYGMSDNLTYTLGGNGFRAYKYVPYGRVREVMPYLMRRAQENSGLMGSNTSKELELLWRELKRRFLQKT